MIGNLLVVADLARAASTPFDSAALLVAIAITESLADNDRLNGRGEPVTAALRIGIPSGRPNRRRDDRARRRRWATSSWPSLRAIAITLSWAMNHA